MVKWVSYKLYLLWIAEWSSLAYGLFSYDYCLQCAKSKGSILNCELWGQYSLKNDKGEKRDFSGFDKVTIAFHLVVSWCVKTEQLYEQYVNI